MFTFHCTKKILDRYKFKLAANPQEPTTVLGNWYINTFNIGRLRYVIGISDKTYLPVIVGAKKELFPVDFGRHLGQVLTVLGIPQEKIIDELGQMKSWVCRKTESKQALGVLVDFVKCGKFDAEDHPSMNLLELSLRLAQTPVSPLKGKFPDRMTRALFGLENHKPTPRRTYKIELIY